MLRPLLLVLALSAVAGCTADEPAPAASPSPTASPSAATLSPALSPSPSLPAAATSFSAMPSATAAAVAVCATAQLRLTVGTTEGGAGQSQQPLLLTNQGAACTLRGHPGVSFLDAAGRQIGSPAAWSETPVRTVLLQSGAAAMAVLSYSNAAAYPDSSCRPQRAVRVRVYPPGQRAPLTAPDDVLVCSVPNSGQTRVGPVEPA